MEGNARKYQEDTAEEILNLLELSDVCSNNTFGDLLDISTVMVTPVETSQFQGTGLTHPSISNEGTFTSMPDNTPITANSCHTASTTQPDFRCDLCKGRFTTKANLRRHIKLHAAAVHSCRLCSKAYHRKDGLIEHMSVAHGGQHYSCEECTKEFKTKNALKLHLGTHKGNFRFVCGNCGEGFNYISNFETHVNRHKGQKPFSCNNCTYKTGAKSDLSKHKKSCGVKEKLFECEICHNRYKSKKTLSAHQIGHADSQRHVCCTCGKGYPYRSSLLNHEKKCGEKK